MLAVVIYELLALTDIEPGWVSSILSVVIKVAELIELTEQV